MQPSSLPYGHPQYMIPYPVIIQMPPPIYSNLTKKEIRGIQNTINPIERVLCAGLMTNLNSGAKNRKRIVVVTDRSVYNLEPCKKGFSLFSMCEPSSTGFIVKRAIDIKKVSAITLSLAPTSQYILHVVGEHDYRFCGREKRNELITSIINAYFLSSQQPFPLFCTEDANLERYQKSEADVKARIDKKPHGDQVLVTPFMVSQGLDWILANRKQLIYSGPGNYTAQYMGAFYSSGSNFGPVQPSTHYSSYHPPYYIPEAQGGQWSATTVQNQETQPPSNIGSSLEVNNDYPGCTGTEIGWIKNRLSLMKLNTHIQLNTDFDKTYENQNNK